MNTHKPEMAISHYIEAGRMSTALKAAVDAQQWDKAADILDVLGVNNVSQEHFKQLGKYYASIKQYEKAEKFYLQGKLHMDVIKMHIDAGKALHHILCYAIYRCHSFRKLETKLRSSWSFSSARGIGSNI